MGTPVEPTWLGQCEKKEKKKRVLYDILLMRKTANSGHVFLSDFFEFVFREKQCTVLCHLFIVQCRPGQCFSRTCICTRVPCISLLGRFVLYYVEPQLRGDWAVAFSVTCLCVWVCTIMVDPSFLVWHNQIHLVLLILDVLPRMLLVCGCCPFCVTMWPSSGT